MSSHNTPPSPTKMFWRRLSQLGSVVVDKVVDVARGRGRSRGQGQDRPTSRAIRQALGTFADLARQSDGDLISMFQDYDYAQLKQLERLDDRFWRILQDPLLDATLFREYYTPGRLPKLDEKIQRSVAVGAEGAAFVDVDAAEDLWIKWHPEVRPSPNGCCGGISSRHSLCAFKWQESYDELACQPALPKIMLCCGGTMIPVANPTGVTVGQIVESKRLAVNINGDLLAYNGALPLPCFVRRQQGSFLTCYPPVLCMSLE
ncbi:hypothetical protein OC861_006864 [Tilletia horrida]|nr:hypothetical protein OC861_006864 [Tilletia horrida]